MAKILSNQPAFIDGLDFQTIVEFAINSGATLPQISALLAVPATESKYAFSHLSMGDDPQNPVLSAHLRSETIPVARLLPGILVAVKTEGLLSPIFAHPPVLLELTPHLSIQIAPALTISSYVEGDLPTDVLLTSSQLKHLVQFHCPDIPDNAELFTQPNIAVSFRISFTQYGQEVACLGDHAGILLSATCFARTASMETCRSGHATIVDSDNKTGLDRCILDDNYQDTGSPLGIVQYLRTLHICQLLHQETGAQLVTKIYEEDDNGDIPENASCTVTPVSTTPTLSEIFNAWPYAAFNFGAPLTEATLMTAEQPFLASFEDIEYLGPDSEPPAWQTAPIQQSCQHWISNYHKYITENVLPLLTC